MKKHMVRTGIFLGIFLLSLIVFYVQPAVFPERPEKETHAQNKKEEQKTTWKYQELTAAGFSSYINQSQKKLQADYGEPVKSIDSGFGYRIETYNNQADGLVFEANIDNGTVSAVKVLHGPDALMTPFRFGMTMQELSSYTTIFPNFSFSYKGNEVSIELMEEDMNYRPLIAFDNGTFAVLFFDQSSGTLFSTVYLNKETLLKLVPYQVSGKELPSYHMETNADWTTIDLEKEEQSTDLLNRLRQMDGLTMYTQDSIAQKAIRSAFNEFIYHPQNYLSEERAEQWKKSAASNFVSDRFSVSHDEVARFLKKNKLASESASITRPVIDPTFSLLYWYSDPYYHARFMHKDSETIQTVFSKENMLVLVQQKEETSSPESSDEN